MTLGRALLVAGLLTLAALPGRAAETVALRYDLDAGGLTVAEGAIRLTLEGGGYALSTDLETTGLAAMLLGFTSRARSEGHLDPAPVPTRHEVANVWRGDDRSVDLRYGSPGAPPTAAIVPPPEEDRREPIPTAETAGTLDPLSAVFALMRVLGDGEDASVTVFDGRRLYRLSADRKVPHAVEAPAYSGPGWRARLRYERLGGRSETSFFKESDKPAEATLDLAPGRAFGLEDGTAVPVRVVVETQGFGALVALLRQAAGPRRDAAAMERTVAGGDPR